MAKMVKRILQQESANRLVLAADRKVAHLTPTWQDMEVLKSIDSALSPLSSLTDILSGETYVTVSAVIPMLQLIKTNLLKEEEEDTQLTKDIKDCIITDLESRYCDHDDVMEILQFATFLDARFKSKPFSDTETDNLKMVIIDQCDDGIPVSTQPADSSNPSGVEPPAKKRTVGTFFKEPDDDNLQQSSPSSVPSAELCKKELESYLSSPKLDFEEDPLAWWQSASLKYPLLSSVARKYLCVCATSSPSERVFSCSGNIVTSLRASMNPRKVDMLTFLSKKP